MKLVPENRLYELLQVEKLWKLANEGDWVPDSFFDFLEESDYFAKEEACSITKIMMTEYEDYPGE